MNWKGRFFSQGDGFIMKKYLLTAVPLYMLSMFKPEDITFGARDGLQQIKIPLLRC